MQFSISLLLSVVCNLIGFHRAEVNNDTVCLVVAVVTQYFTITTLMWMSVLAHHVYNLMGREFQMKDKFFIFKGCFVAWGKYVLGMILKFFLISHIEKYCKINSGEQDEDLLCFINWHTHRKHSFRF